MVQLLKIVFLGVVFLATAVYADVIKPDCGPGLSKCPSHKPCCSQYGQCGVGAFCLGGCDPKHSKSINSCVSAPVCENKKHTFGSLSKVADKAKYLGDASSFDWVADGKPMLSNGDLLLTMEPQTVGTVLASTRYVWYGKIKAMLKTSRTKGVVSAFILMSDVKDEIDFEWTGNRLDNTQTNFYFQGITDYGKKTNTNTNNTFSNWHEYEIDWTPEKITWSVDGSVERELKKSDTYNSTTNTYTYPQTPSRVQLSIWPGGRATNALGTVEWSGGFIDWESPDIKDPGYFYMMFRYVTIECYDPPRNATIIGSKVYEYTNEAGLEGDVRISNRNHVLKSLLATGENMDKSLTKSTTKDSKSDTKLDGVETVPGHIMAGTSASALSGTAMKSGGSSENGASPSIQDQGITASLDGGKANKFTQGDVPTADKATGPAVQGSMLAIMVAITAIMLI